MEKLHLLIKILNKKKLRYINNVIGSPDTNTRILYDLLAENDKVTEEEVLALVYPNNKDQKKKLRKLKSELRLRLMNAMMIANFDSKGYKKALIESFKMSTTVQILRVAGVGTVKYAIELAEEGINKAIKLNLTDSVLAYARILEHYYGAMEGNDKKYHLYRNMVRSYNELLYLETKAQSYYIETVSKYANSRDISKALPEHLDDYIKELKPYLFQYKSSKLAICTFNIEMIKCHIHRQYDNVIEVAKEAITFIESLEGNVSYAIIFSFLYKTIPAYIHLAEFDKANEAIDRCLEITPDGSYNQVISLYYKIILGFHANRYELCYPVIQEIKKYYSSLQENFQEQYHIAEAYVFFFIEIKAIHINKTSKFRISKFLNEVPIFSKDKLGNNINILILQFLFLLNRRQYEWLVDKVDGLKMYVSRYLKKEGETARSYYFIRMLIKIPKADFNKPKVEKLAANDYKKFTATQSNPDTSRLTSEIVPYEVLWEKALAMLK